MSESEHRDRNEGGTVSTGNPYRWVMHTHTCIFTSRQAYIVMLSSNYKYIEQYNICACHMLCVYSGVLEESTVDTLNESSFVYELDADERKTNFT